MKPARDVRVVAYVEWIDSGVIAAGWSDPLRHVLEVDGVTLAGSLNHHA